jgi:phospholipase C
MQRKRPLSLAPIAGLAIFAATAAGQTATPIQHLVVNEPFQFYQSTANPHHLPPGSAAMIGQTDQANHQYDIDDFFKALNAGNLPL